MSAQVGLRNAAASASGITSGYIHKKDSYREKLSDKSLDDLIIEVTPHVVPQGFKGNSPDVDIAMYSKAAYVASGEKKHKEFFKFYLPEMIHRWSNMHTIGSAHVKDPNGDVNSRKRNLNLQTFFPEDIDGELNQIMSKLKKGGKVVPPYLDINEEVRWVIQQLLKLEDKVFRALWKSPDCAATLKLHAITSAKAVVAELRAIEVHELDDEDEDVQKRAFNSWLGTNIQMHHSLYVCNRTSEPDECPLGAKCGGAKCTHKEHVSGRKEYVLKLQDYIFAKNDKDAKLQSFGAVTLANEWVAANESAAKLMTPEAKQTEIDLYMLEKLIKEGYHYKPVYYKKKSTLNQSWKIAEKFGAKAGFFSTMHEPQLAYGNVVRVCVHPQAMAFNVEQGIGLRYFIEPKDIVIVRGKRVECSFDEADDINTFGEDDIDFTKSIADRPMYGMDMSAMLYDAPANAAPPAPAAPDVPVQAPVAPPVNSAPELAGPGKRKHDSDVSANPQAKRTKVESSPDVSEEEDGTEESMEE